MKKKSISYLLILPILFLFAFSLPVHAEESGWEKKDGKWYYHKATGELKTGYLRFGNDMYYLDPESGAMQTGWTQVGKKWYYFSPATGAMKTGWLKKGKNWYYLNPATGVMKTGWLQTDRNVWYYLDPATGAMKTGWKEIKGKWYHFAPSGEMSTCWVGSESAKYFLKNDGSMAVSEVLMLQGKRQGFSGTGLWLGDKSDSFMDAYEKAIKFVNSHTDASMSKVKKLRTCFDLFRTDFKEMNPWIPHYKGMDWVEKYANACLDSKTGNCISYGACLGLMARAIGYDDVYGCNSGGHGWVEIDGKVYDPEWTQHRPGNYFGRELRQGDSPNYLGSVARTGNSWQYRKI